MNAVYCKPFTCTVLDIQSTTNECYECKSFSKCELAINKIAEEDERQHDLLYEEDESFIYISIVNMKPPIISDKENEKDYRWWMN